MSIEDFDNSAPDNRPTERWTRLADAARYEERRKIWRLCGLGDNPPASDAEFIAGINYKARASGPPVVAVEPKSVEGAGDPTHTRDEADELRRCIRTHGPETAPARLRECGFTELEILLGLDLESLHTRVVQELDAIKASVFDARPDESVFDAIVRSRNDATRAGAREALRAVLTAAGVSEGDVGDCENPECVSFAVHVRGKTQGYKGALADAAVAAGFSDAPSTARDLIVRVRHEALEDIDRALRGETLAPHADVEVVAPYASRTRAHVLGEVWRAAGIVTAIEDRTPSQVAATLLGKGRQHALRAALHAARLPVSDGPSDLDTDPVVLAIERKARDAGAREALADVLAAVQIPAKDVADRERADIVALAVRLQGKIQGYQGALADVAHAAGLPLLEKTANAKDLVEEVRRADRIELAEVRRALDARDDESAFEALGRSRDVTVQAHSVEIEQHEEVEVATTAGLILRSVELARGIAALDDSPFEIARYLRLAISGEPDAYFVQAEPPAYSLTEEREHELSTEADAALDARDGAGYLEVLRQVVSESRVQELGATRTA